MKMFATALLAVLLPAAALAAPRFLDVTEGWRAQPMDWSAIKNLPRDTCPPPLADPSEEASADELLMDDDLLLGGERFGGSVKKAKKKKMRGKFVTRGGKTTNWMVGRRALTGLMPVVGKNADRPSVGSAQYNCWYERTVKVPAEWKGRFVAFALDLHACNAVVFVNGKKAGVLLAPSGFVDLSAFLDYGKENTLRLFVNQGGFGCPPSAYRGRDVYCGNRHFHSRATLGVRTRALLEDVWLKPSWREKKLTAVCSLYASKAGKATVRLSVSEEASGTVVKTLEKTVALAAGTNTVELVAPWTDFTAWETDRPFLYRCDGALAFEGETCTAPSGILFGFREVWRERGQIVMNGHPLSVRGYWPGGPIATDDFAAARALGFNCVYATHQHETRFAEDPKELEAMARAGMLKFSGAPTIAGCRGAAQGALREEYGRYVEFWARSCRNYPSVVAASVGVNMMCAASWTMGPRDMGRRVEKPDGISEACEYVKRFHANCMTFAHGDGNYCDIGCSNFYFCFTPLQEREEWYSDWYDRRDRPNTIPYYPSEFGQLYYGSWFGGGVPTMTEFLAAYYGEEAYRAEDERMLQLSREFAYDKAGNYYGGWAGGEKEGEKYSLHDFQPLQQKFHREFCSRVTRAWRGWHCRVMPMYLDSIPFSGETNRWEREAHTVNNHDLCCFIGGDPKAGRQRFCDRTHAYWSGEKVVKSLVMVWDGTGEASVSATWRLTDGGARVFATGSLKKTLATGAVLWEPISFTMPDVDRKTKCVLSVAFDSAKLPPAERTDAFEMEVHPPFEPLRNERKIALYDPRGETAAAFDAAGVSYGRCGDLAALVASDARYLVVGRRALDGALATNATGRAYAALKKAVGADGRHVLVMAQRPETWLAMGFYTEDCAPRRFFASELPGVDDDDLAHWRGSPLPMMEDTTWHWAPDWGPLQKFHRSARGWRWTHTHALSLLALPIPTAAGFRPLVKGEFDMAYSALLRATFGEGSLTLCALDFEGGRLGPGGDPAATRVFSAMMRDWFAPRPAARHAVFVSGAVAARLAEALGFEARSYRPSEAEKGAVLLCGPDAMVDLDGVRAAVRKGMKAFVFSNDDIAKEAGFGFFSQKTTRISWRTKKMEYEDDDLKRMKRPKSSTLDLELDGSGEFALEEEKPVKKKPRKPKGITYEEIPDIWYATTNTVEKPFVRTLDRTGFDRFPYKGVGLSLLRWRESLRPKLLKGDVKGWTIAGDGVFAVSDDGAILIDQTNPFRVVDERTRGGIGGKGDPVGKQNATPTYYNDLRRVSYVLMNWGVAPSDAVMGRAFLDGSTAELLKLCTPLDPYAYVYW